MKRHFSWHQQGSLDGLCGVYSTITCVSHLCSIDESKLFSALITTIGERLPWVVVNGLGKRRLDRCILPTAKRFCARLGIGLRYRTMGSNHDLDQAWDVMHEHQRRHGNGSILLALSGVHEHWTCIERITPRSLLLADSSDLRRLCRAYLTVGQPRGCRRHRIDVGSTFLLHVE